MTANYKRPRPKAIGSQKHLEGEFREAGWTVQGPINRVRVKCKCPEGHKTFLRSDLSTESYVREKLAWLFQETCYDRD